MTGILEWLESSVAWLFEWLDSSVAWLDGIIWSNALIILCLGAGLLFSILTRFSQVRHLKEMVKLMFAGKSSKEGISSFQALSLALSGRVGTGNIAGVATAIAYGGPGAVFWMWIIAFLGAGSAFVESTLSQIYKTKLDGQYRGGPAFYIEKGLNIKWYAILFAIVTVIATGLLLPGVQANSIGSSMEEAFNITPLWTGLILIFILGIIILGGIKRIANTAMVVVPFMAVAYILIALVIVGINYAQIPEVFMLIINSAFGVDATFGGILGSAIAWGVRRGIYSNEAGQGTAPHASAAARVTHPVKQGLVQSFSVYIDTLFICSATAFMILITGMYNVTPDGQEALVMNAGAVEAGPAYTQQAVESALPGFGAPFVAIALLFFAFTTIMAYYYMAETNLAYIMSKKRKKWLEFVLKIGILAAVLYGCIREADLAWALGDIGVGSMAWLNLIAILLLMKPALKALRDYEQQKRAGLDPIFNPEKLGIKNATFWTTDFMEDEKEAILVAEKKASSNDISSY
ncbi:alanine/glycine:cation symporter family protein [Bacillus horti]|uniref:AGCS family alanine or glycine:cation symporter n=1 Tax=Caldalkalibacillus horti TaxID=77523 RepID=A0ABT9W4G7_9BACI|nr:alanine/glycine:cation symporter family protein [Bacillus horti]MDQ0168142.1 AGCS family alanine or glycine:cation symporter [Bacillus horti]